MLHIQEKVLIIFILLHRHGTDVFSLGLAGTRNSGASISVDEKGLLRDFVWICTYLVDLH